MKKKFLAALLSASLVFSLVGCTNSKDSADNKATNKPETTQNEAKKKDGGTLILSAGSDPTSLNPFFRQNRITFTVSNALFDPLFIQDGNDTRYYLAKDLKVSDDMLTYTLTLKDNLKWHDGEKLDADDVMFTIKTALDKKQNIERRESFIVGGKEVNITKKDNLTIEFKLPEVYTPFKAGLADFRPIPKHIFEKDSQKDIAKLEASTSKPIGSGPYKLKEWKKGETLTLQRFNDYYGGKPNIDQIVFRTVADNNSTSAAFENGEISTTYLNNEKYLQFKNNKNFKTYEFDEGMVNYMIINTKNNPILAKKEVRQAICYALDKDEIIKSDAGTTELSKKAYSVFPPTTSCYTDNVQKYNHNLKKAKELMKKAGVNTGNLTFNYVGDDEDQKKQALIVQQELKEIGLTVKPVAIDYECFFNKLTGQSKRDFDFMLNGYVMGSEPSAYAEVYSTNASFNASCYSNPTIDSLFKKADIEKDSKKRTELYEKIQQTIADDAIVYPVDYAISRVATVKNLAGVKEARLVPIYMFEDLSKLYFTE